MDEADREVLRKQGFTTPQIIQIEMMKDAPQFLHSLRLLVEHQQHHEALGKLYPILELNKMVLLETDIPREVIDSLSDHDMFWIAQHVYRWYASDFLKVVERIATA